MRACSTASGGVFFIQNHIVRKQKPVSYSELVADELPVFKSRIFGAQSTLTDHDPIQEHETTEAEKLLVG